MLRALVIGFVMIGVASQTGCGGAKTEAASDTNKEKESKNKELPEAVERVAGVGVGKQGSATRKHTKGIEGMIARPAIELFNAKERIVFQIQIPKAMQLTKALTGRDIRSHQEFMKEIIQKNRIPLPKLPENQVYEFRPKEQKLYVVPKK